MNLNATICRDREPNTSTVNDTPILQKTATAQDSRTLEVWCLRKSIPACEPVSASRCAQAFDDSCRLRIHCRAVRTCSGFNLQRQDLLVLASGVWAHLRPLCQSQSLRWANGNAHA